MKYIALAAALVACGKAKGKDECRVEAGAVGDLLIEAAKEPASFAVLPDDLHLVKRADLRLRRDLRSAPIITVRPNELKFDDTRVESVADLGALASDAFEKLKQDLASGRRKPTWVPEPRLVYLLIDEATTWERVAAVVDQAAHAGFAVPAFLFEAPQPLQAPPRSPIDDKLDAITKAEPSERASEVARLASKLVAGCAPLEKEFGSVSGVEGEDKAMMIATAVEPALIACDCNVNIPELRSVLFRVMFVPRPLRAVVVDISAAHERIELPKTTTWAEASKRFTPTLSNAELIAR